LMEGEAAPEAEVEEAEGDTGPVTDGEVPAYRPRRESQPLFRKPQEGLS
jgi:hypothetical protein